MRRASTGIVLSGADEAGHKRNMTMTNVTFGNLASLRAAVDLIARHVIERRNTIPILSYLLIEPCADGARISGTDLDMMASTVIAASWEEPAAFCIEGALLADILKRCEGETSLRLIGDGERIELANGRTRAKLEARLADDFPRVQFPFGPIPLAWETSAQELAVDLDMVKHAISTEETRYYLNGINVDVQGGLMTMAATDGHRLSRVERLRDGLPDHASAILPRKLIGLMGRALKGADGMAALALTASKVQFVHGALTIVSRLIDGTFPDFRRIIPQADPVARLAINASELASHGKAAATTRDKQALTLEMESGDCKAGKAGADGYARPLLAEYDGDAMRVAISGKYAAEYDGTHDRIEIAFTAPDAPMAIIDPDSPQWLGVLMPMRCDDPLPRPAAVTYRETLPAPGQAADLFNVEPTKQRWCDKTRRSLGNVGIAPGPRHATMREVAAYLQDYAKRCGFPDLPCEHSCSEHATFGKVIEPATLKLIESVDYETLTAKSEYVTIPAQYQDGAYSVIMPGSRHQAPVTVEYQDEAGNWSEPARCQNAKGDIALPDQPKGRKAAKPRKAKVTIAGAIEKDQRKREAKAYLAAALAQDEIDAREADEQPEALEPLEARHDMPEAPAADDAMQEPIALPTPSGGDIEAMPAADSDDAYAAALAMRLAALESLVADIAARLDDATPLATESAPLAAESAGPAIKRTAAHERMIRRAWAERKERRDAERLAAYRKARKDEAVKMAARQRIKAAGLSERLAWAKAGADQHAERANAMQGERDELADKLQVLAKRADDLGETMMEITREARRERRHRLASAQRARRLITVARANARDMQQQLDRRAVYAENLRGKLHNAECRATSFASAAKSRDRELASLRASMADPMQPERASDIHRLIQERDEAKTALAAVHARNTSMQGIMDQLTERYENMALQVARLTAAQRQSA
jgi:DNA polymerase III subunit beta